MDSLISLDISESGVTRISLFVDNDDQQARAHVLLAACAHEIRALDAALRGCAEKKEAAEQEQ